MDQGRAALKLAIKRKLQDLDAYIDDELTDYIMAMVANERSQEEMTSELELFLKIKTPLFTKWLFRKLTGDDVDVTDMVISEKSVPVVRKPTTLSSIVRMPEEKVLSRPKPTGPQQRNASLLKRALADAAKSTSTGNAMEKNLVGRKVKSRRPVHERLGWLRMSSDYVPHGPNPKKKYLIEPGNDDDDDDDDDDVATDSPEFIVTLKGAPSLETTVDDEDSNEPRAPEHIQPVILRKPTRPYPQMSRFPSPRIPPSFYSSFPPPKPSWPRPAYQPQFYPPRATPPPSSWSSGYSNRFKFVKKPSNSGQGGIPSRDKLKWVAPELKSKPVDAGK
ncbi:zinc finger CCCH domain-containing protein 14-like isoform X2 [Oscarella lobularis]|uniref:zinc finger CCCH domain-containing protein 14-like isoform X2 n=1 Tax=Oscarella lobularis TaxID=121494 RepID=UPI0033140D9A